MSTMQPHDIARIAAWLADTDIGLLELHGPGTALRLRHDGAGVTADEIAEEEVAAGEAPDAVAVHAPSVGVFLRRHPLRGDDLAPPGAEVAAGQALGLLQIGPLLLPVQAPADAVVLELLVPHGTAVGYGTALATVWPIR